MISSRFKRPNKTYLLEDDLESFLHLLKGGYSLKEALDILETPTNQAVIQEIQKRLENGEQLISFIAMYCPKTIQTYLKGFLSYLSFENALDISLRIVKEKNKNQSMIQKGLLYPIFLLVGTCLGTLLFAQFVLPSMIGLMQSFMTNTNLIPISNLMRVIAYTLLLLIVSIAIVFVVVTKKKYIVQTYQYCVKHFPYSLFVLTSSYQFIVFYLSFMETDTSTKNGLEILSQFHEEPIVSYIATSLKNALEEGKQMEEVIKEIEIDPTLKKYFKIGIYSNHHLERLKEYLYFVEKQTKQKLNRLTKIIQLSCYSMIGIIVIFIYQILFIPMEILQSL